MGNVKKKIISSICSSLMLFNCSDRYSSSVEIRTYGKRNSIPKRPPKPRPHITYGLSWYKRRHHKPVKIKENNITKYWPVIPTVLVPALGFTIYGLCSKNKKTTDHVVTSDQFGTHEWTYEPRIKDGCAIASIVNTLKQFKIKMTQKQLLERIQKKFPEVTGGNVESPKYIGICKEIAQEHGIFFHHVDLNFSGFKLNKQLVADAIAGAILKFYELIGKRPFWIDDSYYDPTQLGHMVNVHSVSRNEIIIYDNLGFWRNENLNDFVSKYFSRKVSWMKMGGFGSTYNINIDSTDWLITDDGKKFGVNGSDYYYELGVS